MSYSHQAIFIYEGVQALKRADFRKLDLFLQAFKLLLVCLLLDCMNYHLFSLWKLFHWWSYGEIMPASATCRLYCHIFSELTRYMKKMGKGMNHWFPTEEFGDVLCTMLLVQHCTVQCKDLRTFLCIWRRIDELMCFFRQSMDAIFQKPRSANSTGVLDVGSSDEPGSNVCWILTCAHIFPLIWAWELAYPKNLIAYIHIEFVK